MGRTSKRRREPHLEVEDSSPVSVSESSPPWEGRRWPLQAEVAFGIQCVWRKKEDSRREKNTSMKKVTGMKKYELAVTKSSPGGKAPPFTAVLPFLLHGHTPTRLSHTVRSAQLGLADRMPSLVRSSAMRHLWSTYYAKQPIMLPVQLREYSR